MANYLSQPGKQTFYFLLLARVEGLNLSHVPGGRKRDEKYEEQAKASDLMGEELMREEG